MRYLRYALLGLLDRRLAIGIVGAVAGLIAAVAILTPSGSQVTTASHAPGAISLIYLDMDTTGNTIDPPIADAESTTLGPVEECARINNNDILDADETGVDTLEIDVVVADWPANGDQLKGYDIVLNYDPALVNVTAVNSQPLVMADPQSSVVIDYGDAVPDSDGTLMMSVMDALSPWDADESVDGQETSAGYLARVTLEAVAPSPGQTTLSLTSPGAHVVTEEGLGSYVSVTQVNNGFLAVDQPCVPGSQPGPAPSPPPPPACSGGPDSDGDGFSDCVEAFVGTDASQPCAADSIGNNEDPDALPVDFDDDQDVDVGDFITAFFGKMGSPAFNPYSARSDLNTDSAVNVLDWLPFWPHFLSSCTPPTTPTPTPTPTPAPDSDGDGYWDDDETDKGSLILDDTSTPEHCDGVDNDGDTEMDEEPAGADWDIDGDTVKDCLDSDVFGADYTATTDDDGDDHDDVKERSMSTDELADCPTDKLTTRLHDAWPPDRDHDGDADVGDVIAAFFGKILDAARYDARSDADADGDVDIGDVIILYGGNVIFTSC